MKNLLIYSFATFVLLVSISSSRAYASHFDLTIPADPYCTVFVGEAQNQADGSLKVIGELGFAAFRCGLSKRVRFRKRVTALVRVNFKRSGSPFRNCDLTNFAFFNQTSRVSRGITAERRLKGDQSLGMFLNTVDDRGYLSVACVLSEGDILYGIRWRQAR